MNRLLIKIDYGYTNRQKLTRIPTDDKDNIRYLDEKENKNIIKNPVEGDNISLVRYDEINNCILSCNAKMTTNSIATLLQETLETSKEDYRA